MEKQPWPRNLSHGQIVCRKKPPLNILPAPRQMIRLRRYKKLRAHATTPHEQVVGYR